MFVVRTDLVGPRGTATIERGTPQYAAEPCIRVSWYTHQGSAVAYTDARTDTAGDEARREMARKLADRLGPNTTPSTVAEYQAVLDAVANGTRHAPDAGVLRVGMAVRNPYHGNTTTVERIERGGLHVYLAGEPSPFHPAKLYDPATGAAFGSAEATEGGAA